MIDTAPGITATQIRPQPGRILVRRLKKPEQYASGLYRPDQSREVSQMGVVIAAAPDVLSPKVGEVIIFSTYASLLCVATNDSFGDDLVFVRAEVKGSRGDVVGIIEPEEEDVIHA